uniref:LAGLIDADG endonuclease type 1 n=1 Tax=Amanita thiersii TaxID=235537 RepID=A0A5Q0N2F4_9AGAR|nr:LAGLIDADG endonuclease type 1 [Amanita thiersii]QFZ98712.1 LAGLIDADG endonuclease type 1 [Amanita thiersii]
MMKNLNKLNKDFTKPIDGFILNPNWVTGFIDGEGSFIIVLLSSTGANKKKVSLRLSVTQKSHSAGVLYELKKFFGCGIVIPSSKDCMRFVVQSKEDIIHKVIPHFIKYPLQSSKELNFKSFKEASDIVVRGDHLKLEGLKKIMILKNEMNKNRSFEELFNHLNLKQIKINPFWIQGFVDAEGSFGTLITKSEVTSKIVTRNRLSISQSTHDYEILKAIKEYFNVGNLQPVLKNIDCLEKAKLCKDRSFYYNSSPETFIPFFEEYPMLTRKYLDFQDFKRFYQLKKEKQYLTEEGFNKMFSIALNMNSGRDSLTNTRRHTNKKK